MSIKIQINNADAQTEASNVQQLAQELNLPERGVAIAVNNQIAPRASWSDTSLNEGDRITVIKAAFGG